MEARPSPLLFITQFNLLTLLADQKRPEKQNSEKKGHSPGLILAGTPQNASSPVKDAHAAFTPLRSPTWTPGSPQERPKKRSRTSLKLNLAPAHNTSYIPTISEEAMALASALADALEIFCRQHRSLIRSQRTEVEVAEMHRGAKEGGHESPSTSFWMRATTANEHGIVDPDKDDDDGRGSTTDTLLEDLRNLSDIVIRVAKVPSSMEHIPRDSLYTALAALEGAIVVGRHLLLEPEDVDEDAHVRSIVSSLEASVLGLRLAALCAIRSDDLGPPLISEEFIESIVDTLKFQLQQNVLPFCDGRLRSMTRPSLGREPFEGEASQAGDRREDNGCMEDAKRRGGGAYGIKQKSNRVEQPGRTAAGAWKVR